MFQNTVSHIVFFFILFKGYRCNWLSAIAPDTFYGKPRKQISNFIGIKKTQVVIGKIFHFVKF